MGIRDFEGTGCVLEFVVSLVDFVKIAECVPGGMNGVAFSTAVFVGGMLKTR